MAETKIISATNRDEWNASVARCGFHDTYHLAQYHLLAEGNGEGSAFLFAYSSNGFHSALPILLRPTGTLGGLEDFPCCDATTVYGYPGIVSSALRMHADVGAYRREFQLALVSALRELKIVSLFCRLNPLIETSWLLEGLGDVKTLGKTIVLELGCERSFSERDISKGHRCDLRKALRIGIEVSKRDDEIAYEAFYELYTATMRRVGARPFYYFSRDYFKKLREYLAKEVHLFCATLGGKIISAAIFFKNHDIIQYHLSGTADEYQESSAAKHIIDSVGRWGHEQGARWLHLGGGVGAKEDGVYRFKAGFSRTRLEYRVLQVILNAELYSAMSLKRNRWLWAQQGAVIENDYFPRYRGEVCMSAGAHGGSPLFDGNGSIVEI